MHDGLLPGSSGITFSAVSLALVAGFTIAYLGAARAQWRAGRRWSSGRVGFLAAGAVVLGVAFSPPLAAWAHADLRGHMVQHLLVGMLAPLGIVLAAPVTLLLRTLTVPAARRLTALLRSRAVQVLSHPVTALALHTGGLYVLYLTPLYAAVQRAPLLHALLHVHFLAAGVLFSWAVLAGPDPAPRPPAMPLRLGVLFCSIAAHAVLGKVMYAGGWPRGTIHPLEEIEAAAQLMYYGGDFVEMLLIAALFGRWYRARDPGSGASDTTGPARWRAVSPGRPV